MNSPTDTDDAETRGLARLLTPEGMALLDSLGPYDPESSLSLSESLRAQGHDPELVAAALTQSRLREKARAKFGEFAQHMVFTRDGVEQATRWSVAALHAQRFAQAGIGHVVDLGYQQVPVVETPQEHWSGYRPDKITSLATAVSA